MLLAINIQNSTITLGCFDEAAKLHAVAHIGQLMKWQMRV